MKLIDDYCEKMRKKTERLLLKMFNYKTIKEAFDERKYLISELKKSTGKDIADFEVQDIRKNPYLYARYKTIDKILSIYIDLITLDKFIDRSEK